MRATKQKRSADRQQEIAAAAIALIGECGPAMLTHKAVAARAGVSLAATTYYFETKGDIIAEASRRLLDGYVGSFARFADRRGDDPPVGLRPLFARVLGNVAGDHRVDTLAWCEIMLDAARRADESGLARSWFDQLSDLWDGIARSLGVADADNVSRSVIDLCIGLFFVILPLGLDEAAAAGLIDGGLRPAFSGVRPPEMRPADGAPWGAKAAETRRRILDVAVGIIATEGMAGISFRAVADKAGLTRAAPTYHFPSIESLLDAAQIAVFERTKARYREGMAGLDRATLDAARLARITTAIFRREARDFGLLGLAAMPIRLEAARNAAFRTIVRDHIEDQNRAWRRVLVQAGHVDADDADALIIQSLSIGKLIRIVSTGARKADLARVGEEFGYDISAIIDGSHWTRATA